MSQKPTLPEIVSVDSGVFLAYLLGEEAGTLVRDEVLSRARTKVYTNRLAISELFYIVCRRRGESFARDATEALLRSGYVTVSSPDSLDTLAGSYKCARGMSLADCYVLALAKMLGATAVFARREADLAREIKRGPFDVDVLFLEDLAKRRG